LPLAIGALRLGAWLAGSPATVVELVLASAIVGVGVATLVRELDDQQR
jgi:hypothetical protein